MVRFFSCFKKIFFVILKIKSTRINKAMQHDERIRVKRETFDCYSEL